MGRGRVVGVNGPERVKAFPGVEGVKDGRECAGCQAEWVGGKRKRGTEAVPAFAEGVGPGVGEGRGNGVRGDPVGPREKSPQCFRGGGPSGGRGWDGGGRAADGRDGCAERRVIATPLEAKEEPPERPHRSAPPPAHRGAPMSLPPDSSDAPPAIPRAPLPRPGGHGRRRGVLRPAREPSASRDHSRSRLLCRKAYRSRRSTFQRREKAFRKR